MQRPESLIALSAGKINEATPVTLCADSAARALARTSAPSVLQTISLRDCLFGGVDPGRRKTTIDVTDLIWKGARMAGFSLFAQSPTAIATAWQNSVAAAITQALSMPLAERRERHGALFRSSHTMTSNTGPTTLTPPWNGSRKRSASSSKCIRRDRDVSSSVTGMTAISVVARSNGRRRR
jgi:hypothetical protein